MKNHNLVLHDNNTVTLCPKCQNNTDFEAIATLCSDDPHLIHEIHVQCICGYDPTLRLGCGYRHQNEPGEPEETSVEKALATWNMAIVDAGLADARKAKAAARKLKTPPSLELMIVDREQDFLASALQDKYLEEGHDYSYRDALDELVWMARCNPEKFMTLLPDLRRRSEKHARFEEEVRE